MFLVLVLVVMVVMLMMVLRMVNLVGFVVGHLVVARVFTTEEIEKAKIGVTLLVFFQSTTAGKERRFSVSR